MSIRVRLRGMLRLIRVNTLRRVHNVFVFLRDGSRISTVLIQNVDPADTYLQKKKNKNEISI